MTPIVDAAWLAARLEDPDLRIADCRWYLGAPGRGRAEYAREHITGAIYVDLDGDLSGSEGGGRHPLPAPGEFADRIGRLGIGNGHVVVAYDDRGGVVAARLWWMLTALGHERAAVLDGGLPAWKEAGGATTGEIPDPPRAGFSTDRTDWSGTIDRLRLTAELGTRTLIDARAPERYRGDTEPVDPIAGHIPTAMNLPYRDNLDDRERMLDAAVLRHRFAGVDRPVVYCGSGVTACHHVLAMEVAGLARATLYPGSWSEWSTAGGVIATG